MSPQEPLFPASSIDRQFAHEIVRRLVDRGYVAYYAGGCVRDALLGLAPKDFDVATNATPDQVREIFGPEHTRAVGEAFGVVLVHGRIAKKRCQVEVATFRTDGSYSDGRRPDWVEYATAEQDAQRRDFTINGLFYDPIANKVIDFVEGQEDLAKHLLRAIGDPYARISEDKLRMLRAIRFASRYGFALEERTQKALSESSHGIRLVSGERIGMELEKILEHPNRAWAWSQLDACGLLEHIAPELRPVQDRELLDTLPKEPLAFPLVLAALAHPWGFRETKTRDLSLITQSRWRTCLEAIQQRWKLPNDVMESACICVEASAVLAKSEELAWSQVQPKLLRGWIDESIVLAQHLCVTKHWPTVGIDRCIERVADPAQEWNPAPWITGSDLIQAGLKPGPAFGKLLSQARAMQLDGQLTSAPMALEWLREQTERITKAQ
ncbi:MAG: CCA tRNA nucleotidyltransferase [Planctomycetes bacterium]|nr:CCA tRNA nucleotidyltransferase [Planctomycetota bacterium]